jgi:NAD(P)-dependent dehydrogenase (short-subunit alcohol dehydrogenase family)
VDALVASRGRVVMVSSRMAAMQLPLAAAYGASKRALVAYADALRLELGTHVGVTCVYPSAVRSPIHDSTAAAGLSLEGMSSYEPLEGVVDTVLRAGLSHRVHRDLPTTRKGAIEFFLARHLPSVTDRIIARTLAGRARSGAFAGAELAAGVVRRHGGPAGQVGRAGGVGGAGEAGSAAAAAGGGAGGAGQADGAGRVGDAGVR